MIALEIIGSLFVQLVFTVGFIMLYGGFISLCNRCFLKRRKRRLQKPRMVYKRFHGKRF